MALNVVGLFLVALSLVLPAPAQQGSSPVVTSPKAGEVIRGLLSITGSTDVPGFVSAELSFAYVDDPQHTWFYIATSYQPAGEGILATLDTTTLRDGKVQLRLRVYLADGTYLDALVEDLTVGNTIPTETVTASPTLTPTITPVIPTLIPTITPTKKPFPTPTALPTNPAVLLPADIYRSAGYGAAGATILLVLIGIYLLLSRK